MGSGKSFSIRGCDDDPGMLPLCIRDLFDYPNARSKVTYLFRFSCFEIYDEDVADLLADGNVIETNLNNISLQYINIYPPVIQSSKNLRILSEDPMRGVTFASLTEVRLNTRTDFVEALRRADRNRTRVSSSSISGISGENSRAHIIYRVCVESSDLTGEGNEGVSDSTALVSGVQRISTILFADIAGKIHRCFIIIIIILETLHSPYPISF
jgi:centromeric protein E